MKAEKITHNNEIRIKVVFPYNQSIIKLLKQISGVKWSQTHKAWHIPYTKDAFNQLKTLFPEIEIQVKEKNNTSQNNENTIIENNNEKKENIILKKQESKPEPKINQSKNDLTLNNKGDVKINVFGKQIAVQLPTKDEDTRFLLSFKFSRWDKNKFCWIIPNYGYNLKELKNYFENRICEFIIHEHIEINTAPEVYKKIDKNEILIIKTNNGRLKLFFDSNKDLTRAIKSMPFNSWNAKYKYWCIPFTDKILLDIKQYAENLKLKCVFEEEVNKSEKKEKYTPYNIPNYRRCPEEYILKLKEMRYSEQTIKVYSAMFEGFINFYHKFELNDIEESMITDYLRHLVFDRKVSSSTQNQAINAVKFYYEKVLGGNRKIYLVERPRKEQTLPVVLNEEE